MHDKLSVEEQSTNYITMRHIERVRNLINNAVRELLTRGEHHDQTKLERPEVEIFTKYTDRLATATYDSEEYRNFRKEMDPALQHHYANNRHHPEHHANGVNDMDLLDLVEMFCDWKAASERHNNGNILTSITKNADRFGLSPQLVAILINTAKRFDYK